jgi:hypothetical protein
MEADWEFEVGGDAPLIEACWEGFIDLRQTPERARELPEAGQLSVLSQVLERLNSRSSPVWTSKCDVLPALAPEDFDSDELDAPPGCSAHGMACYIDLLPGADRQWSQPRLAEQAAEKFNRAVGRGFIPGKRPKESARALAPGVCSSGSSLDQRPFSAACEAECKHLCALLSAIPLRCCRVDFIIRGARIAPGVMGLGVTSYITACGPSAKEAKDVLETALSEFANALCPHSTLQ